jgi:hypothetical protein
MTTAGCLDFVFRSLLFTLHLAAIPGNPCETSQPINPQRSRSRASIPEDVRGTALAGVTADAGLSGSCAASSRRSGNPYEVYPESVAALILRTAQFGSRTWQVSRVPGARGRIRLAGARPWRPGTRGRLGPAAEGPPVGESWRRYPRSSPGLLQRAP